MKKDLVSIIVPIYNVEKYLPRCIDSILNQTYKNIEVLLIDDGSTDNSGKICDNYKKKDKRIKVFHKKNGGLSDARNYGINNINGKYVSFVDSDDIILQDCIASLYKISKANNSDISIGQIYVTKNKIKLKNNKIETKNFSCKQALNNLLLDNISVSANCKLYKSNLFNNIKYPKNKLFEDNGTTYKLIMESNTITVTNKILYIYFIRKESITNKKFTKKNFDYIKLTDLACNDILKKYPDLILQCNHRKLIPRISLCRRMLQAHKEKSKEYEEIINYFQKNKKEICSNKYNNIKTKTILLFLSKFKHISRIGVNIYEQTK